MAKFRGTILHSFGIENFPRCVCLCPILAASTPMGMQDHPFALSLGTVTVPLLLNAFVANGL